jgi:hypothetical protein
MSSLSITGAGFDANADIQVHFFDKPGYSVKIPASDVKATSLTVSVPGYISPSTGTFSAGVVNVEVIQKSGTNTLKTNTIEGLQITDLPTSDRTTGAATLEYLDRIIQLLRDSQYHLYCLDQISNGAVTDTVLSDCLSNLITDYTELKTQVQSIITAPGKSIELETIKLPTGETLSMSLNIEAITTIDRLVASYNQRLANDLSNLLVLAPASPKIIFAGWKMPSEAGDAEPQAGELSQDNPFRIQNESIKRAQQKIKTANDSGAAMVSLAEPVGSPDLQGEPVGQTIRPMSKGRVAARWVSSTFITGLGAMAQDYSAASAATGSEAMNQGKGFISGIFTKLINKLASPYDQTYQTESKNKSWHDIIPDFGKKTSAGILISESPLANNTRQGAIDSGRLPQDSGLDLLYYTDKPAAPDNIVGLWTGTGWSYYCCLDDGTRLSKVTWNISIFVISQKEMHGDVVGKITMTITGIERLYFEEDYHEPHSTGPDLLANAITNNLSFTFTHGDEKWSWDVGPDPYHMDGLFIGPGPGTWCVGKTFHLEKFR